MIEQSISHYRIIRKLGAGGMGEVYLAEDTQLGRTVALKILPADVVHNRDRMRRFLQEARAAAALHHPHVAHIYEIGEANGTNFITMEHVEGQTLDAKINGHPLETDEIVEIGIETADALAEAHAKGITHRDIKPSNIMVTLRGRVKVLDFGLAKITAANTEGVESDLPTAIKTTPGVVLGTVAYMSPEQALGREVDHRTDIFSLGVVLYEMATGKRPFTGQTATETIDRIAHAQPEAVSRFNYDIPTELERIIRKCLEKDRERRYQTASELVIDLKNLQRDSLAPSAAADKRDTAPEKVSITPRPSVRRALAVALALTILAAVVVGVYWLKGRGSGETKINSIAVMPFVNVGANADAEYLADGITETLINKLSQLRGMKVIARNSVFRYKGREVDAREVGRELNVEAVLTGRVVERGDALSISVELTDARDNTHLWGEQYNRRFADILTMQAEISRDISERLRLQLTSADEQRLARRPTENPEAYQLYLRGRFFWNKRTIESLKESIKYFNQAIELDPTYALAYAGLADSYIVSSTYGFLPPHEAFPRARAAAMRAIELDDTLAEAHNSLSSVRFDWEWDWAGSLRESERAIELNPNYATAHQWYAGSLSALGRHEEAIRVIHRAQELDPLSLIINSSVGYTYYWARQYDQAIAQCQRVIEMDANFAQAYFYLALAYEQKGMYREALAAYQRREFLMGITAEEAPTRPEYYPEISRREYWQRRLDQLRSRRQIDGVRMAQALAQLGERDQAFEWLERAYRERVYRMTFIKVDPALDPLRDDPRFQDIVRRMGFPP